MKKTFVFSFFLFLLFDCMAAFTQATPPVRHKIAVFAPLYLDSAFDVNGTYRFNKTFPKFLNSGLEFYQGAQLALDSLQKTGAPLDVFFYDSRSKKTPLPQQINSPELKDVELIIGHANSSDVKLLAGAAQSKKVPFISATLPNDAGVYNNPYFVILNSTLRTHCEGIYSYLQKYHSLDRIVLFTKNGAQEEQVKSYFDDITHSTSSVRLNIQTINVGNSFITANFINRLDSTRRTYCIVGSLDEEFGTRLTQQLAAVSATYPVSVIGMPTWDGIDFSKPEFKDVEVIYSTPFFYTKYDKLSSRITNEFVSKTNGKPTDMYYRGYEVMLHFALLLLETKKDLASNITQRGNTVFTPFDLQPVFLNKQNMTLDYFENKKLFFIKIINGVKNIQY